MLYTALTTGLLLALLLNLKVRGNRITRTIGVLPWIIPALVEGLMFKQILSGSSFGIMNIIFTIGYLYIFRKE